MLELTEPSILVNLPYQDYLVPKMHRFIGGKIF